MDLAACIAGSDALRRRHLLEYNDSLQRLGFPEPAAVRSLLTDEFRLTVYRGLPWGEIYDLREDPRESHNRWQDADYATVRAELAEVLLHEMMTAAETSPRARFRA